MAIDRIGPRLVDLCPEYAAALDEYFRGIAERTPEEDVAAWRKVTEAARQFRAKPRLALV